jgi:hypothetical protein
MINRDKFMNTEQEAKLQEHLTSIAEILYKEASPEKMKTFEGIETTLRDLIQKHVAPELAIFLSKQQQKQQQEKPGE